jgi:hypothetical protein
MKIHRIPTLMIAAIIVVSVAAFGQEVKTDYDHHANFERFHSYRWEKVQTTDPLWQSRIQEAVDQTLQAKGWQRVDRGGDIAITAVGSARNQQEYQTFYDGMGGWRWRGFGETTTQVENYAVGSLVLDFYDSANKQLVWRGIASDTLSDKPQQNEKKLEKSVDKMLKDFPPHEKG